jgi:MFS family permease
VIAPLVGGFITTYASWHWLFLINVPLGVIALASAARIVHPPAQEPPGSLDIVGVLLTCVGLASLTATCALLSRASSDLIVSLGACVLSAVLLTLAVRHLMRTPNPLVELRTLRIPTLRLSVTSGALYYTAIGAAPFLAPLLFEEIFGWSAVKSGAVVLFIFVGNIGIKPSTTFLYSRFGFRKVLIVSTATMAAMMVAVGFTDASTPVAIVGLILLISGAARSVGATGYMTMAYVDVPEREMRHAGTLQTTISQLALGFGVAGGAIALRAGGPISHLLSKHPGPAADYRVAFAIVALVALAATFGATRLHPTAGDVVRGAPRPAPAGSRA